MNLGDYLSEWISKQAGHQFVNRDVSSISWDFVRDLNFLQVQSEACNLQRWEKESLVRQVLANIGMILIPEPVGLLVDALELSCRRCRTGIVSIAFGFAALVAFRLTKWP